MFLPKGEDGIAGLWGDPGIKGHEVCLSEYKFCDLGKTDQCNALVEARRK